MPPGRSSSRCGERWAAYDRAPVLLSETTVKMIDVNETLARAEINLVATRTAAATRRLRPKVGRPRSRASAIIATSEVIVPGIVVRRGSATLKGEDVRLRRKTGTHRLIVNRPVLPDASTPTPPLKSGLVTFYWMQS